MKKRLATSIILLTSAFVISAYSQAQQSPTPTIAGKTIAARGNCSATQKNTEVIRPLKRRTKIFSNDTITTGDKSSAKLRLADEALISFDPNTVATIESFIFSMKKDKENQVDLKIVKGGFKLMSGLGNKKTGSQHAYKIKSPTCSMGIRGTNLQFKSSFTNPITKKPGTCAAIVTKGTLFITNRSGQSITISSKDRKKNALFITAAGNFTVLPGSILSAMINQCP